MFESSYYLIPPGNDAAPHSIHAEESWRLAKKHKMLGWRRQTERWWTMTGKVVPAGQGTVQKPLFPYVTLEPRRFPCVHNYENFSVLACVWIFQIFWTGSFCSDVCFYTDTRCVIPVVAFDARMRRLVMASLVFSWGGRSHQNIISKLPDMCRTEIVLGDKAID